MAAQWRFIASLRSIRDSRVLGLLHSPKRTPSLCMASNVSKSPSFQHDSHSSAHRIACLRGNMCLPTSFHDPPKVAPWPPAERATCHAWKRHACKSVTFVVAVTYVD